MRKIILYVLIIVVMVSIFLFSNEPASSSNKQSGKIIDTLIDVVENITNQNFDSEKRQEIKDKVGLPIRKCAHFTIYFTLSVLLFLLLKEYNLDKRKIVIVSLLICILYACTDEIHQLFTSGRSCEIKDAIIDTMGAMLGTTICLRISRLKLEKSIKKGAV